MQEAESIHRALEHKPLQDDSETYRSFKKKIEKQILKLEEKHPEVKISRGQRLSRK